MGLVQREIEAAGVSTIILSNIWTLTASVSVPRLAAIEHPFGATMGRPGDRERQGAVLRAALEALAQIREPGGVVHLPFEWPPEDDLKQYQPPVNPPITDYLLRHPMQVPRLFKRKVN